MKKILLLFIVLFLLSCSDNSKNNENEEIITQEEKDKITALIPELFPQQLQIMKVAGEAAGFDKYDYSKNNWTCDTTIAGTTGMLQGKTSVKFTEEQTNYATDINFSNFSLDNNLFYDGKLKITDNMWNTVANCGTYYYFDRNINGTLNLSGNLSVKLVFDNLQISVAINKFCGFIYDTTKGSVAVKKGDFSMDVIDLFDNLVKTYVCGDNKDCLMNCQEEDCY